MAITSKTEQVVDIGKLIARKPGVRGGRPHVVGAGVTVRRIVSMRYWEGLTPEQIAEEMPHLDLAGIYAALAFYHANQAQMDAEFAAEEVEGDKLEQEWLRSKSHA
jgi:uncharacterized protein (DUF433 family)